MLRLYIEKKMKKNEKNVLTGYNFRSTLPRENEEERRYETPMVHKNKTVLDVVGHTRVDPI